MIFETWSCDLAQKEHFTFAATERQGYANRPRPFSGRGRNEEPPGVDWTPHNEPDRHVAWGASHRYSVPHISPVASLSPPGASHRAVLRWTRRNGSNQSTPPHAFGQVGGGQSEGSAAGNGRRRFVVGR